MTKFQLSTSYMKTSHMKTTWFPLAGVYVAPGQHGQQGTLDCELRAARSQGPALPFPLCAHLPLHGADVWVKRKRTHVLVSLLIQRPPLLTSWHGLRAEIWGPGAVGTRTFCSWQKEIIDSRRLGVESDEWSVLRSSLKKFRLSISRKERVLNLLYITTKLLFFSFLQPYKESTFWSFPLLRDPALLSLW